jgi:YD repeat-containing protein
MERIAVAVGVDALVVVGCIGLLAMVPHTPSPTVHAPAAPATDIDAPADESPPPPAVHHKYPDACQERHYFGWNGNNLTGAPGEVITRAFDAAGRVVREDTSKHAQLARTETFEYDTAGRLARQVVHQIEGTGFVEITRHHYDRAGHETRIETEDVGGKTWITRQTFDTRGRLAHVNDHGFGEWYHYDAQGRLAVKQQDNDEDGIANLDVRYRYDAHGLLLERTEVWYDATQGDDDTFTYDDAGRLVTETDRLGFTWTSSYDAAGNLTEKVRTLRDQVEQRVVYDYGCWERPQLSRCF